MPLSDHEQRLLEQMERALYAEDPKFATSMRDARSVAGDKRRIAGGVVAVLTGMGLLIGGVATQLVIIGVLGFLAMLAGIWLVLSAFRAGAEKPEGPTAVDPTGPPNGAAPKQGPKRSPRPKHGESLSERMEERWRRRRETGDF